MTQTILQLRLEVPEPRLSARAGTRVRFIDLKNPHQYVGLLRDAAGHHWLFLYDYATQRAGLRGDVPGWDEPGVLLLSPQTPPDLTLEDYSREVMVWLVACWDAVTPKPAAADDAVSEGMDIIPTAVGSVAVESVVRGQVGAGGESPPSIS